MGFPASGHDQLPPFAQEGFRPLNGKVDALLMHEARHHREQRATRNCKSERLAHMLDAEAPVCPGIAVGSANRM